ncbi:voltage-dependent anion channel [Pyrenochaeta sp. MPI-SDFR-AT-0127]|nr:voltage-dependent anion channel [Pyrenochaeta sp. MPI-SDFR-AT-0127]
MGKEQEDENGKLGVRRRLKHFTWAWFVSTMSTGGLAIALGETPHQFKGLYYIGLALFIFDIILFLSLSVCMAIRAILFTTHFKRSFLHPQESFFFGAFWLSISVIIGCIQVYGITRGPGHPWLVDTVYVLYWMYAGCSLVNSIFQYWVLIRWSIVRPIPFLPSIFLAGYPAMLTGTIASLIAGSQPPERALAVIVSGCAYQGFGWLISFVAIVALIRNLLDHGLPPPAMRPGMFIPVGACAYTVVALMGLAMSIPNSPLDGYFASHPMAAETLQILALFIGVFLWLFAFWLFAIAFLANISVIGKMPFSLTWWAFIFPNVGFTIATSTIGRELESEAILWVASVMTILLVAIWFVSAIGCCMAVWQGKIVWPGRDEDKTR